MYCKNAPIREILILTLFLTSSSAGLFAQEIPGWVRSKVAFCDSNLSDAQAIQLRLELSELEDYFLEKRFLADRSGESYRSVYEQIAKENDLNFEIGKSFDLLDSLEFEIYTGCFYKVLTPEQLSQLTSRHLKAAERIAESYEGDLTPGLVAQRVIDNLTAEDFELEFYRVSSLLTFYGIASPLPQILSTIPEFDPADSSSLLGIIKVQLDGESQLVVDGKRFTSKQVEELLYEFLKEEPSKKGVEISTSRSASYESYLNLRSSIDSIYVLLEEELGSTISRNIIFPEPR